MPSESARFFTNNGQQGNEQCRGGRGGGEGGSHELKAVSIGGIDEEACVRQTAHFCRKGQQPRYSVNMEQDCQAARAASRNHDVAGQCEAKAIEVANDGSEAGGGGGGGVGCEAEE
jgi:hypothetical protein